MGHHCEYVDRIEIEYDYETEQKYLYRVVNARWKEHSLDVYKELEDNTYYGKDCIFARNILFCNMGGYLVTFPGEKSAASYWGYYGGYDKNKVQELEDWTNTSPLGLWSVNLIDERSERNIIEVYPSFKYVLKKIKPNDKRVQLIWELLKTWKEHPEIEGLCQLGFYSIAMNNNLFKLTAPKRKQIIKWICEHKELVDYPQYLKLVHIQKMIKYKLTVEEFKDYEMHHPTISKYVGYKHIKWDCDIPTWQYLKKIGFKDEWKDRQLAERYYDYKEMATKVGHNMKDKYWLYPSNLDKAHDKVMEEAANIRTTTSALQGDYLKAVMKPMADKYNAKVDGYDIFLPTDIATIQKQCDVLYQCLLRNNYVNQVLMQKEILVFIWKDGVPQATAQVYYNKEVGQFYADERGHVRGEDCLPSEAIQKAFYKWLETFNPYKVKAERKKEIGHYYKGFHSVDALGVFHTSFGNYSFEVGKTYNTDFGDNEILAQGENCMATNKVFHFCKDINDIERFYAPTCYAEVEPLGPVIENNGAYLSNRIKIIRALDPSEVEALKNLSLQTSA